MISFRFHVVSITAIFLAIAIGVVVGTTFIDRVTVNSLETRIDTVEHRADRAREENGRLESELETTREALGLSAEYAVSGRLPDVPALVVAARGVEEDAVERTVVLARRAGGRVPGILWLEPRWGSEGEDDVEALSAIVGGSAADSSEDLWRMAWEDVTEELSADPVTPQDPDGVPLEGGSEGSTLTELEEAGFVSVDSLDDSTVGVADLLGSEPRMLVVTGASADEEIAPVIPVAVDASVGAGLITVVADIYVDAEDAPGRGAALIETFDDALREAIVIVDHADLEAGRVAAILALDAAGDGEVGLHYGYGEGADAVLPAWTPP